MSGEYSHGEAKSLLTDIDERTQAVAEIFDNAILHEDLSTLLRIRDGYSREFLETALGGYPDYLDENDVRGEQ